MKEMFELMATILAIFFLLFMLELIFEPAQAAAHADTFFNTIAHIYHNAVAAFK
jgi:hypothetical protein